ncbi:TIR domain-containing protein [Candidatus Thiodiazotropha sp. LNASS1]|uniref:TIR domain-containing protein n=1 Tax=Candidatus Thiodiazotropha sp. LNASS1 TaxID=3096260 RepID=UPI0034DDF861
MPLIFVSYRREDSAGHAGRLFDRLQTHFGKDNVFWDVSGSIEPGEKFDLAIERAVTSCDVLLAVIGRRWSDSRDVDGNRRLDKDDDFVRLEIGKALQRDVKVVPVLVDGAELPGADELPEELAPLTRRQVIELTETRWDFDVTKLVESIERSFVDEHSVGRKGWILLASTTLVVAIILGVWLLQVQMAPDSVPEVVDVPPKVSDGVTSKPDRSAVSGTQERVLVPALKGMSLDAARTRLQEAGLKVGDLTFLTLGKFAAGTVYCQRSKEGVLVRSGSAIGLCVEREKLPGIHFSGQIFMTNNRVFDLDGVTGSARGGFDIRFDTSNPSQKLLQPKEGAVMVDMERRMVDAEKCATAPLSDQPVRVLVGHTYCLRTSAGRYAAIRVEDIAEKLKLSFDTYSEARVNRGSITLVDGESYHFSSGDSGRYRGGDFYVTIDENGGMQFNANNAGQKGVLDLGDIGLLDSAEVNTASLSGFYKFGVPAIPGHIYVSPAREGEEGHFIIFTVSGMTEHSLTIDYRFE